MISKVEVTLSREDVEKIYEEETRRDRLIDSIVIGSTIVLAVLGIIAGFTGYSGAGGIIALASVGAVLSVLSAYLTVVKRRALEKLRKVAGEKGEVKILAEVNFSDFKILE